MIFTARKRSLGQGNVFTCVCHSVRGGLHSGRGPPPTGICIQGGTVGQTPPGIWDTRIWSTSGRYASHWNAFLFVVCFVAPSPYFLLNIYIYS